ncbi:MAG TPA: hypothetical protein VLG27_04945 [Candidatus Saccharimonadia bacterium]|nr:hypothetical protein [Candidatus Saccharimonadia bacterium]
MRPESEDGKLVFRRPTIQTSVQKVGRPRYVKRGQLQSFERDGEPLPMITTQIPNVTIAEYDNANDVVSVRDIPRNEFEGLINDIDVSRVKGSWVEKEAEASTTPLQLTGRDSAGNRIGVFDEINRQLAVTGSTSWQGVSWQRGSISQEVIWDAAVKKRAENGVGYEWERTFVIRTTNSSGEVIPEQPIKLYGFPGYLEALNPGNPSHGLPITNLRLSRPKHPQPEATTGRQEARLRGLAKLALSRFGGRAEQKAAPNQRQHQVEDYLRYRAGNGPEKKVRNRNEQIAVWLLNYPGLLTDEGRAQRLSKLYESEESKRRIMVLRKLVEQGEIAPLYDKSIGLREEYLAAVKRIGLPLGEDAQSISRIFEALADDINTVSELLGSGTTESRAHMALVDRLVGHAALQIGDREKHGRNADEFLIQLRKEVVPTGKLNALDLPANEIIEKLELNERFFSRGDDPIISKVQEKAWRKKEAFRQPVRNTAKVILMRLGNGLPIPARDVEDLGHNLRLLYGA